MSFRAPRAIIARLVALSAAPAKVAPALAARLDALAHQDPPYRGTVGARAEGTTIIVTQTRPSPAPPVKLLIPPPGWATVVAEETGRAFVDAVGVGK